MIFVFAIVATFISMGYALLVAYQMRVHDLAKEKMEHNPQDEEPSQEVEVVEASKITALPYLGYLHHVCMLDVACMGIICCLLSLQIYESYGMAIHAFYGLVFIIIGEAWRHFLIYHLTAAAEYHNKVNGLQADGTKA